MQNPITGKHEQVTRHSFAATIEVVKQTCIGKEKHFLYFNLVFPSLLCIVFCIEIEVVIS